MVSLSFNKRTAGILSFVLPFILSSRTIAYPDLSPVADLELSWVGVAYNATVFHPGEEIVFVSVVHNKSDATSDSYTANFYIGNFFIGSLSCDPLEGGENETIGSDPLIIPEDIPDEYYYVWTELVCSNDSDLSNNRKKSSYRIRLITPYPEIAITDVEVSGDKFRQGDSIRFETSIAASGYLTAENIFVEYYIGEYLLDSTYRDDLEPGETEDFTSHCQLPDDLPDGWYTVRAVVSCTDDKDPENNEMDSGFSFWVGPVADLEVKGVQGAKGTFMPKDLISVYSLVENIGDGVSNGYTIDYYLSQDQAITIWDYHLGQVRREGLEPGAQHSYNTTFQIPLNIPEADYYVGIVVTCQGDTSSANNSGSDSETLELIHPPNYVCGRVTYEYPNYDDQPVRYAMVKIYDSDSEREIGLTYTDLNGNYGVVVLNDDDSTRDIFARVLSESVSGSYPGTIGKICSVRDDVYEKPYTYKSSDYLHPQDSSRTINMIMPVSWRPFMVFDSLVEAFHQAKTFFGIEMQEIAAHWPSADNGTYYYPPHGIFISRDDEWERDIMLHEYGHYIADVYQFAQGSVGDNGIHTWDRDLRLWPVNRSPEHAANLAFRESWPTLFSIASQLDDYTYPNSGDTKYQDYSSYYHWTFQFDLETDTFDDESPGEFYESMNCCLLWDIFDDNRDRMYFEDTVSDPNLTRIWTVMRGYKPEDMNDFWVAWYGRYGQDEDIEAVTYLFQEHNMTFAESGQAPALPQNNVPVAVAGEDMLVLQDRTEGAMVHLDGSGSYDPDEDELTYTWRYGYIPYSGAQLDIVLPVGTSELELEVTDGEFASWDTVMITVTNTSPENW